MTSNASMHCPAIRPRPAGASPALEGVRVVDFTHFVAGPLATMILADMGADVVKIEAPSGATSSATTRRFHPRLPAQGAPYMWTNRNKRSLAVDLKSEAGLAVAAPDRRGRIVWSRTSRPASWSASASTTQPTGSSTRRLIYCSVSAYGREGPFRRPARLRSHRTGRKRLHLDERLSRPPGRSHAARP